MDYPYLEDLILTLLISARPALSDEANLKDFLWEHVRAENLEARERTELLEHFRKYRYLLEPRAKRVDDSGQPLSAAPVSGSSQTQQTRKAKNVAARRQEMLQMIDQWDLTKPLTKEYAAEKIKVHPTTIYDDCKTDPGLWLEIENRLRARFPK